MQTIEQITNEFDSIIAEKDRQIECLKEEIKDLRLYLAKLSEINIKQTELYFTVEKDLEEYKHEYDVMVNSYAKWRKENE